MLRTDEPLILSHRRIREYSADEYSEYVRSLYVVPAPRKVPVLRTKKAKAPAKLTFGYTKKGKLTVRGKRKWLTEFEYREAAKLLGVRLRIFWCFLRDKKLTVREAPPEVL